MTLLKKSGGEHIIFEHKELNMLIAVEKTATSIIKKYWKQYKGKKDIPNDTVIGFPMVYNEEQESMVIDFSKEDNYVINQLKKSE